MVEIWCDSEKGSSNGTGTKTDPVASIPHALSLLSGGRDVLRLRGTFKSGLKLHKMTPESLLIDGQGATLFFGFEGGVANFDPLSPSPTTWGNISITDCHNIILENVDVWGGNMHAIYLEDGYPEVGLKNITLDRVRVRHYKQRGIFMGGHNIRGIYIKGCDVQDSVFDGPETHGIYLSGGHWRADYGVEDVHVTNTKVAYSFGRHGIQFNGRCRKFHIEGCTLFHNEMAGISLIGVQDAVIRNNQIYGNNRQGIVVYDYDHNKFARHANRNIRIFENSIVVGPYQWKKDAYHNSQPTQCAAVAVNCNLGAFGMKPKDIRIERNVIWTPTDRTFAFTNAWDALAVSVSENMVWANGDMPMVYAPSGVYDLPFLDKNATTHYRENIYEAPRFVQKPEYEHVDLTLGPYNFENHVSEADLYSFEAYARGIGAKIPHPRISTFGQNDIETRATGEKIGPWWEKPE